MFMAYFQVDVSSAMGLLMAPKEENELTHIKKACSITSDVFTKYLRDQIMDIIDSEKVGLRF